MGTIYENQKQRKQKNSIHFISEHVSMISEQWSICGCRCERGDFPTDLFTFFDSRAG